MSAPAVDDILARIRTLPEADRELLERRLEQERPAKPARATETAADLRGLLRDRIPPECVGATAEQLRAVAEQVWGEREARFRAEQGGEAE